MCRIAGIITLESTKHDHYDHVNSMCLAMANGGPDGHKIYQSEHKKVTLGNRRLALLDLSENGAQPMTLENGITITYNGEIYNHLEIKKELENLNYKFKSTTDTEVVLIAYKHWGIKSFAKLRGMYSFCIYDPLLQKVILVRSPLGIKPLYYSTQHSKLIFASEVKAFIKSGESFETSDCWKIYLLAFGHIPEPQSTLANVFSLPKGTFLSWDLETGDHSITTFFEFTHEKKINTVIDAKKQLSKYLRRSVKKHLLSDAPIGIFLSGGIDSSILTLIADECTRKLKTISLNFKESNFSEEKFQNIIKNKILSEHISHSLTQTEFNEHLKEALNSMDQPSNDGLNTWHISKIAKENGLKAVLSGIGPDELLGGYVSFRRSGILKILNSTPNFIKKIISKIPIEGINRTYFLTYNSAIGDYLFLRGIYDPKTIARILKIDIEEVNKYLQSIELKIPSSINNKKERISYLEFNLYLQNQLLKDIDYMSMYHGIEIRTPYLDEDFVQTCLSIDNKIRFDLKLNKQLLVDTFADILPEKIYNRKKMGFSFPFNKWLKNNKLINAESIYKSNTQALKLLSAFKRNRLPWAKVLVLYQIKTFTHSK